MKTKIIILCLIYFISTNAFCQQIGDGFAPTDLTDFTFPLNSGVYGSPNPIGSTPDTSHPWQHLFVIRHGNPANNHQLQIGSAFATNDRLFFRKIEGGLEAMNPTWIELATRGANNFLGNQRVSGNVGIGSSDIGLQTKLHVKESGASNGVWRGRIVASGDQNAIVMGEYNGKAWLGAHNSQLNGWSDLIMQADGGNIGIGTTTPASKLDVIGSYAEVSLNADAAASANFRTGGHVQMSINTQVTYPYTTSLQSKHSRADGEAYPISLNPLGGNVGIGTTNPTSKLTVAGNINSREVKVSVDAGADFVFDKEYDLPSLNFLDSYIKENKHLPEIASAKEMQENGINLSEMNIKLLQKIEELTLYVIEQSKQLKVQNEQLQLQNGEIQLLKKDKNRRDL